MMVFAVKKSCFEILEMEREGNECIALVSGLITKSHESEAHSRMYSTKSEALFFLPLLYSYFSRVMLIHMLLKCRFDTEIKYTDFSSVLYLLYLVN